MQRRYELLNGQRLLPAQEVGATKIIAHFGVVRVDAYRRLEFVDGCRQLLLADRASQDYSASTKVGLRVRA